MSPFMTMVMVRGSPSGVVGAVLGPVEVVSLDVGDSAGDSVAVAGDPDDASDDRAPDEVPGGWESALSVDDVHPASATAATSAASHRRPRGGRRPGWPQAGNGGRVWSVIGAKHRIRRASLARRLRPGR